MTFKEYLDTLTLKQCQYKNIFSLTGIILYLDDLDELKEKVILKYLESIKATDSSKIIPGVSMLTLNIRENKTTYIVNIDTNLTEEFMTVFDCHDRHSKV